MRVAWVELELAGGVREPCLVSLNPKTNRLHHIPSQRDTTTREPCSVLSSVSTTSGQSSISSNGTRTRAKNREQSQQAAVRQDSTKPENTVSRNRPVQKTDKKGVSI